MTLGSGNVGNIVPVLKLAHRIVSTKYFYSSNILYCFLWMFSSVRGIVKVRVLVVKSPLAPHLSEGLPVSQNLWCVCR